MWTGIGDQEPGPSGLVLDRPGDQGTKKGFRYKGMQDLYVKHHYEDVSVSERIVRTWRTPFEQPSASSLFLCEFNIYGQINDLGRGDQLRFMSLSRQSESAIEKGYCGGQRVDKLVNIYRT